MTKIKGTLQNITAELCLAMAKLPDKDKVYVCEVKEYRKKRSLNANDYYWKLLSEYADWAKTSKVKLHNVMLAQYGQPMVIDEKVVYAVIPDTQEYLEHSDVHLRPTSEVKVGRDSIHYRTFTIIRGSHSYNTAEMSILIDGLISEIQGSHAPIQTMTPDELKRLKGYGIDVS